LPGLTEAAVQHLYFHLGITTLDDLQTLVRSHFLRTLPGIVVVEDDLLEAIHARLTQQSHSNPPARIRSAADP
jgi:DNA polymerase (family 10)